MGSGSSKSSLKRDFKMNGTYTRKAHHAGSWYSSSAQELDELLEELLDVADAEVAFVTAHQSLRGVITPHAGYSYSGPTAAFNFHALRAEFAKPNCPIRHIIVFHPSHHAYLPGCAVSGAHKLETPLGSLPVDDELRQEILTLSTLFTAMDKRIDEQEHSGEMQYPYIRKCIPKTMDNDVKVLPIMCGSLSPEQEEEYGRLLAPIVARDDVCSVVSTDFCHWGSRFSYQPTSSATFIYEYISQLDRQGMNHIEMKEPGAFAKYLRKTRNTICGRHAIGVWLNAIVQGPQKDDIDITFVKYAQSSQVKSMRESSVSYASAVATINTPT